MRSPDYHYDEYDSPGSYSRNSDYGERRSSLSGSNPRLSNHFSRSSRDGLRLSFDNVDSGLGLERRENIENEPKVLSSLTAAFEDGFILLRQGKLWQTVFKVGMPSENTFTQRQLNICTADSKTFSGTFHTLLVNHRNTIVVASNDYAYAVRKFEHSDEVHLHGTIETLENGTSYTMQSATGGGISIDGFVENDSFRGTLKTKAFIAKLSLELVDCCELWQGSAAIDGLSTPLPFSMKITKRDRSPCIEFGGWYALPVGIGAIQRSSLMQASLLPFDDRKLCVLTNMKKLVICDLEDTKAPPVIYSVCTADARSVAFAFGTHGGVHENLSSMSSAALIRRHTIFVLYSDGSITAVPHVMPPEHELQELQTALEKDIASTPAGPHSIQLQKELDFVKDSLSGRSVTPMPINVTPSNLASNGDLALSIIVIPKACSPLYSILTLWKSGKLTVAYGGSFIHINTPPKQENPKRKYQAKLRIIPDRPRRDSPLRNIGAKLASRSEEQETLVETGAKSFEVVKVLFSNAVRLEKPPLVVVRTQISQHKLTSRYRFFTDPIREDVCHLVWDHQIYVLLLPWVSGKEEIPNVIYGKLLEKFDTEYDQSTYTALASASESLGHSGICCKSNSDTDFECVDLSKELVRLRNGNFLGSIVEPSDSRYDASDVLDLIHQQYVERLKQLTTIPASFQNVKLLDASAPPTKTLELLGWLRDLQECLLYGKPDGRSGLLRDIHSGMDEISKRREAQERKIASMLEQLKNIRSTMAWVGSVWEVFDKNLKLLEETTKLLKDSEERKRAMIHERELLMNLKSPKELDDLEAKVTHLRYVWQDVQDIAEANNFETAFEYRAEFTDELKAERVFERLGRDIKNAMTGPHQSIPDLQRRLNLLKNRLSVLETKSAILHSPVIIFFYVDPREESDERKLWIDEGLFQKCLISQRLLTPEYQRQARERFGATKTCQIPNVLKVPKKYSEADVRILVLDDEAEWKYPSNNILRIVYTDSVSLPREDNDGDDDRVPDDRNLVEVNLFSDGSSYKNSLVEFTQVENLPSVFDCAVNALLN